ncbi:hypothetical protein BAY59_24495 [Prauserella coralliicola]|nr:hypothetical protein BAY59_24495 [Prauserella coralliicola]
MNDIQRRIEVLVAILTVLVIISLIGMFLDSSAIMFLAAPVIVAVLLYLSVAEVPAGPDRTAAAAAIHVFNLAHAAVWVGILVTLQVHEATFWGLPPASGLLVYVFWPFSAVAASLLYAYVSKRTGLIDRLEQSETGEPAAGAAPEGA